MLVMFGWGAKVFFHLYAAARRRDRVLRRRQAVDVEVPAPRGQPRDQRAARAGRPADQAATDLRGRDPQPSSSRPSASSRTSCPAATPRVWFEATKTGTYHLFCAEYCGAEHSRMIGRVVVMEPDDYEAWLAGGPAAGRPWRPPARALPDLRLRHLPSRADERRRGRRSCDGALRQARSASLGGGTRGADDNYLRESILDPAAKIVAGYQPIMPTYQGQVTRGAARAARRLRQVAWRPAQPAAGRQRMTPPALRATIGAEPRNYLNADYGVQSWLLTKDHKRIAHPLPALDHRLLRARRPDRGADPPRAADAGGRPGAAGHLQPALHHARRDDGLLLPHPVDPGDARQLPRAADDRRQGPGLPAGSTWRAGTSSTLGGLFTLWAICSPAASTPAGPSTRRSRTTFSNTARDRGRRSASSSPASRRSSPGSTSSSPSTACGRRA